MDNTEVTWLSRIDWLYHLRIFFQGLVGLIVLVAFLLAVYHTMGILLFVMALCWKAGDWIVGEEEG